MQLAIIAPTSKLMQCCISTDLVQMCLAHQVLHDEKYADFYRVRVAAKEYVILDNGSPELGKPIGLKDFCRAIELIKPSEICLPDKIRDAEETIRLSSAAYSVIREKYPEVGIQGVVQGSSIEEWKRCLDALLTLGVDVIGIPRIRGEWSGGRGRRQLVNLVPKNMPIHLLGWPTDDNGESIDLGRERRVRSIDTCKPVVYALSGVTVTDMFALPKYPGRPDDYFDRTEVSALTLAANLDIFRKAVRSGLRYGV